MNLLVVVKVLGMLLLCEAVAMLPSLVVALIYKVKIRYGLYDICFNYCPARTFIFKVKVKENVIRYKGACHCHIGWLLASLMGSLPFCLQEHCLLW